MEDYPFKSHFIKIDTHELHYVDEGQGPILLMLHGNPTWSYYWRNLIKQYSQQFRVIAIDHMGCGKSDKPQDYSYTLAQHISNLSQLIESLQLETFTLFVHDWGGAIGMGHAVKFPHQVSRIIAFNTAAFRSSEIPLRISVGRIPGLGKWAIQGLNAFAKAATVSATAKGLSPSVKQGYLAPYDSFKNRVAIYEFVQDIPMKASHRSYQTLLNIEENLGKLKQTPILLIWGAKDWCFHMGYHARWLEFFPDAESEVLEEAGHYVVEDCTKEVVARVNAFLDVAHLRHQ